MKARSIILILSAFLSSILVYFFRYSIVNLLNCNLPFRESYQPRIIGILFVYALPILLGLCIKKVLKNGLTICKPIQLLNTALVTAIICTFPLLLDQNLYVASVFNNLSIIFYVMIFPFLFSLGIIIMELAKNINLKNFEFKERSDKLSDDTKFTKLDIAVMFTLSLLIFILNLFPLLLSKYPVGADVYYHIAMVARLSNFNDLFKNPFFLGERNYYISFIYFLLTFLVKITKLPVLQIYSLSQCFFSSVFISVYYALSKKISKNSLIASLATILILPFRELLWPDPSLKMFSYAFFVLFLYNLFNYQTRQRLVNIILSIIFLTLTVASHPELAIQSIIIFILWLFIKFIKIPTKTFKTTYGLKYSLISKKEVVIIVALITFYLIVFQTRLSFLTWHFSANQYAIFNEIAFSSIQPLGVVSFLVLLFFPL